MFGCIVAVVDEHDFKDQSLFFRFTRDDGTYAANTDVAIFYRGLDVYNRYWLRCLLLMRDGKGGKVTFPNSRRQYVDLSLCTLSMITPIYPPTPH